MNMPKGKKKKKDNPNRMSFTSYLGMNDSTHSSSSASNQPDAAEEVMVSSISEETDNVLSLRLLPGELMIAGAKSILRFNALTGQDCGSGLPGALVITNFRLCFVSPSLTHTADQSTVYQGQRNLLIGCDDIALTNIDNICHVVNGKPKKLTPGSTVSSTVEVFQVYCKDFRIVTFSFKLCKDKATCSRTIVNSILHHAFPVNPSLVFAFDLRKRIPEFRGVHMYRLFDDWLHDLKQLQQGHLWRVCQGNESFHTSEYLPRTFVVPASLTDNELREAALFFVNKRVPLWCWTGEDGTSLLRMSTLQSDAPEGHNKLKELLTAIKDTHPNYQPPKVIEMSKSCPAINVVQESYNRLRDLCMPESVKHFWSQDERWCSSLDAAQWLQLVRNCLQIAVDVCKLIREDKLTVVLQEPCDCDFNCIISCLVQLFLDPRCRTLHGFQCLIQREWVSLGHPFFSRLGMLRSKEELQAPLFLLFLDCVWQVTQQFSASFEFTETYLTTLWDSTHLGIFETFLFDTEFDRCKALREHPMKFMSVWDLARQFSKEDISLFRNPLYVLCNDIESSKLTEEMNFDKCLDETTSQRNLKSLTPSTSSAQIILWKQCYMRWIPLTNIVGGGAPSSYLQQCILVEEILQLHRKLDSMRFSTSDIKDSELFFSHGIVDAKSPVPNNLDLLNSAFPFTPDISFNASSFFDRKSAVSTPLRTFVKHSSLASIEMLDDDLNCDSTQQYRLTKL